MKLRTMLLGASLSLALSVQALAQADPNAPILAAANTAIHSVALDPAARSVKTDVSSTHYDMLVRYAQEVVAEPDARRLLQAFIEQLMKIGADPSGKVSLNVCSVQTGLKTPTGKDAVRQLGCLHYDPFSEKLTYRTE